MLTNKYGESLIKDYHAKNILIKEKQKTMDLNTCNGQERIIYKFGESVMDQTSVTLSEDSIQLSEFNKAILLPTSNPYMDYKN